MAATFRVFKGLLTKRTKAAHDWLEQSVTLLGDIPPSDPEKRERSREIRLALRSCKDQIDLLESSMLKLANAFDKIEEPSEEDDKQLDKYMEDAQELIMKLHRSQSDLEKIMDDCSSREEETEHGQQGTSRVEMSSLAASKLPQIPIPIFTGKRWDWDNFWALFQANVHNQDLTNLQKFNYLLSSLKGEARQSISRFHVTSSNYEKAIDHLQKRYGNKDGIIMELNRNLSYCAARGPSTADQRHLFDRLSALASQLKEHGENLDSQLTIQTFLHKFHGRIQKIAMEQRLQPNGHNSVEWTLDKWLTTIDNIITQEEILKDMLATNTEARKRSPVIEKWKGAANCECCGDKGHKWNFCPKIPSPQARKSFLVDTRRCLNCGSTSHSASSCSSGNCRRCGGKHHTAICYKGMVPEQEREGRTTTTSQRPSQTPREQRLTTFSQQKRGATKRPTAGRPINASRQHAVTSEATEQDISNDDKAKVLHLNECQQEENSTRKKVILLAGSTHVLDSSGNLRSVTVLLDTGSELSFVEESLAQEFALPVMEKSSLLISTFGSPTPSPKVCDITVLTLCDTEGVQHQIRLHKNDFLTGSIEQADLNQDDLEFIEKQGIVLSLPTKQQLLHPQILLGCDYLWNFLLPMGRLTLPSGLMLIPTKFGYIISGQQAARSCKARSVLTTLETNSEKEMWDRYWSLESSGTEEYTGSQRTETELINDAILQNFKETTQHRDDGYYVRLPWKETHHTLPDNKMLALKRLHKVLEMYDEDTLRQYNNIFREQCDNGVIKEVPPDRAHCEGVIHYLPHQAVITPRKETTKMRIVFDASAHYKDSPCLNDVLHQGPLLLPDLVGMLLRFRIHPIVVISDVEKAFLQVRLQEIDRDATRCLWVRNISLPPSPDNIVTYRFTRVTFGLNTSPFLLGATINFHLDQLGPQNEMASEIKRNLYVDNLIYGARTPEEAWKKYDQSKEIFEGLNMNLREFMSNSDEFNNSVKESDLSKNHRPKVLGIPWNTNTDKIILKGTMTSSKKCTKRTVSQQIASVFDPIGLLVPLLLPAKVFLQSLWRDEFTWDESLPPNLQEQWRILSGQISTFYKEIDRRILQNDNCSKLFAFSDASQFAMATCVYIASTGNPQLVMAKSKLPSLRTSITIPKLEMNALTLSARVTNFVCNALEPICRIKEIVFFTDSEIALAWVKTPPTRKVAGTLVTNRLREIGRIVQELKSKGTDCVFRYISTKENPADCGTRGVPSDVLYSHFWWTGPQIIRDFDSSRHADNVLLPSQLGEEKELSTPAVIAALMTKQAREQDSNTLFRLSRFKSLYKAQRVVAYVMRFIKRSIRNLPESRKEVIARNIPALHSVASTCELTGAELRIAKKYIIRDHQAHFVTQDRIKSQKNLNIHEDEDGLLRCFGRLQHADISVPSRTPIFVTPKTALARLIILEAHGQYHRGVTHTMSTVREGYWIPRLRQQIRSIIRKCIPCQKLNGLPYRYPNMDALPRTRVQRSHPFEHIGLDYFEPITITGAKEERSKAYGCILSCRTTRLVHLELVENMTTESFLNALRRLFARRGVPTSITSDNAPTFLLGEQILLDTIKRVHEDQTLERAIARREIEWIHITPYAPWQGGFFERLIRSIKHSLYKALGNQIVSFDVLRTMLVEIEAVLNSRPLTYQEEQWEQHPILRPIDFQQRNIILDYPLEHLGEGSDPTYHTPEEAQQLATQQQVEAALKSSVKLTTDFWKIWSSQYLTGLREHHEIHMDNKRGTSTLPHEGEVVLLCDSSQPRNTWKIGRIVELDSNMSNNAREAVVELPNKSRVRRPVNKLVPLEITAHMDEESSLQTFATDPSSSPSRFPPSRITSASVKQFSIRNTTATPKLKAKNQPITSTFASTSSRSSHLS